MNLSVKTNHTIKILYFIWLNAPARVWCSLLINIYIVHTKIVIIDMSQYLLCVHRKNDSIQVTTWGCVNDDIYSMLKGWLNVFSENWHINVHHLSLSPVTMKPLWRTLINLSTSFDKLLNFNNTTGVNTTMYTENTTPTDHRNLVKLWTIEKITSNFDEYSVSVGKMTQTNPASCAHFMGATSLNVTYLFFFFKLVFLTTGPHSNLIYICMVIFGRLVIYDCVGKLKRKKLTINKVVNYFKAKKKLKYILFTSLILIIINFNNLFKTSRS